MVHRPVTCKRLVQQLLKLIDVIKVIDHTRDELVGRELMLVKIRASEATTRAEIMQIASVFRAKAVDISDTAMMLEATGKSDKLDAIGLELGVSTWTSLT